jgi:hypothetical protein
VKLGEAGAVWLAPDRDIHVDAPSVKVVDTTGAGDSFNAGFLVAWMNGKTPEQCLTAGNRVGARCDSPGRAVKIAVIGGAGVECRCWPADCPSDLSLSEIALYDIDQDRLRIIANLASQMADGVKITTTATPEPAIDALPSSSPRSASAAPCASERMKPSSRTMSSAGSHRPSRIRHGGAIHPADRRLRPNGGAPGSARVDDQLHQSGQHHHAGGAPATDAR